VFHITSLKVAESLLAEDIGATERFLIRHLRGGNADRVMVLLLSGGHEEKVGSIRVSLSSRPGSLSSQRLGSSRDDGRRVFQAREQ
jgi:hypothetical protein